MLTADSDSSTSIGQLICQYVHQVRTQNSHKTGTVASHWRMSSLEAAQSLSTRSNTSDAASHVVGIQTGLQCSCVMTMASLGGQIKTRLGALPAQQQLCTSVSHA